MEESFSRGSIPACICSPLSLSHPYYEANYLLSTPRAANSQDAGKKTKTATGRWLRHMDGCGSGASTVCLSGSKINIPAVYLEHYRWSLIINVERSRFFRNDVRGKGPAMSEPEFRPCIGGPDWIITCKQAKKSSLFCCLCCWHTHTHIHTQDVSGNIGPSRSERFLSWQGSSKIGIVEPWAATIAVFFSWSRCCLAEEPIPAAPEATRFQKTLAIGWTIRLSPLIKETWKPVHNFLPKPAERWAEASKVHQCIFCVWKTLQIWRDRRCSSCAKHLEKPEPHLNITHSWLVQSDRRGGFERLRDDKIPQIQPPREVNQNMLMVLDFKSY